jgi:hypothetical protein
VKGAARLLHERPRDVNRSVSRLVHRAGGLHAGGGRRPDDADVQVRAQVDLVVHGTNGAGVSARALEQADRIGRAGLEGDVDLAAVCGSPAPVSAERSRRGDRSRADQR